MCRFFGHVQVNALTSQVSLVDSLSVQHGTSPCTIIKLTHAPPGSRTEASDQREGSRGDSQLALSKIRAILGDVTLDPASVLEDREGEEGLNAPRGSAKGQDFSG
jgi:hypothetical protein